MYKNKKVSVVFSTYNEKDSVRGCIEGLFRTGYVDEVIAVDNNAVAGTKDEIKKTKASYFHEKHQGFGYGFQRALRESTGDILIMIEPDGTFDPQDIVHLLRCSDSFDVVFGTRTNSRAASGKAHMSFLLRQGNYALAKLVSILFRAPPLTDVGCTYRLIKRKAYDELRERFTVMGDIFNLDMMLHVVKNKIPYTEVSIRYLKRIGVSSLSGNFLRSISIGFAMFFLILKFRLGFR